MRGKSRNLGLILCAGLAACAGEVQFGDVPTPPVPPEALESASMAYSDCLFRSARQIDDGKLTPIGLALKVIPLCEMQFGQLETAMSGGQDRQSRRAVRDNLELEKEELATRIVLRERLERVFPP